MILLEAALYMVCENFSLKISHWVNISRSWKMRFTRIKKVWLFKLHMFTGMWDEASYSSNHSIRVSMFTWTKLHFFFQENTKMHLECWNDHEPIWNLCLLRCFSFPIKVKLLTWKQQIIVGQLMGVLRRTLTSTRRQWRIMNSNSQRETHHDFSEVPGIAYTV